MEQQHPARRLPVGAEVVPQRGVDFRVWAPRCRMVEVVFEPRGGAEQESLELRPEGSGYFSGLAPNARAGWQYWYRLDGSGDRYPDPASRFQPDGPHGPSCVVDAAAFEWTDAAWPGSS